MSGDNIVPHPPQPQSFRRVLAIEGHYINDHCVVGAKGAFHLFYILGEVGKGCYTPDNEVAIGHAVSRDLTNWTVVRHALHVERDSTTTRPWEAAHIFAPFVIEAPKSTVASGQPRYYMYYSSDNESKAQFINLAVSDDLYTWRRHERNPVLTPPGWALWEGTIPSSCRDAHILLDREHGYLLYYVADLPTEPQQSCIAVARSRDLVTWEQSVPVLSRRHSTLEAFECKTESPCVVRRNGLYYLFDRHGNGTKFTVSSTPLSFEGCDSYLLGPLHAAEVFEVDGRWYATSCSRPLDDLSHRFDRTDGFFIGKLVWDRDWPRLV